MSTPFADRLATYGVERRPDGDYDDITFTCPSNNRHYISVRPVVVDRCAVTASCFWCDTSGRVRHESAGFQPSRPQPHTYPLLEASHDDPR